MDRKATAITARTKWLAPSHIPRGDVMEYIGLAINPWEERPRGA